MLDKLELKDSSEAYRRAATGLLRTAKLALEEAASYVGELRLKDDWNAP